MLRLAPVLAVLALGFPALAEPAPNVTVGLQPMMLVLPMIDATIEYQPTPRLGIAVRPGIGHIGIPGIASATFYEIGGAANVYLTRDFAGWHAGTELYWLWGDTSGYLFDQSSQMMTSASAERVAGVYSGYKWIGWRGLTAVIQLGVGRLDQKQSPDGPISKVIPVGNLDVGWSF